MTRVNHNLPEQVFKAVIEEVEHQNNKWGIGHVRNQSLEGHLLILRKKLRDAENGWLIGLAHRDSAKSNLEQIAAVAIQALINLDTEGKL